MARLVERSHSRSLLSFVRNGLSAVAFGAAMFSGGAYGREIETVGVVVGDLGNPFFEKIGRGVEDAAARLIGPSANVIVRSSGYDLGRQIAQIDQFINEKTDLLIVNAVDTERIGPAIWRARQAGMIVIAIDVEAAGAQATVTSENQGAGALACEYIAKRLGGIGNVIVLNGPPVSSVVERVEGCKKSLEVFSGIKVLTDSEDCGGSVDGGLSCMSDTLAKFQSIDAVFAINDPTAIGADIAASRSKRTGFFIVSIDGSPHGMEVIAGSGSTLAATVAQDPSTMTEIAVSLGVKLFAGQKLTETNIKTPVRLLTKDDIGSYSGWNRLPSDGPGGK